MRENDDLIVTLIKVETENVNKIRELEQRVEVLEQVLKQFETRYSSEQATYIVVSDVPWQEWHK